MCASEHRCLPHTYIAAQSSGEATACSTPLLCRMGSELKAWDTLGAPSFPAMLQWISSRPLWGHHINMWKGSFILWDDGLTTQPLLCWRGVALSLYWAQCFCFCMRLGKGRVCAQSLSIFSPQNCASLCKTFFATQLPQCSCHTWMVTRDFQVGRCSQSALGVVRGGIHFGKNSPYLKVWLPMPQRVLVVHGDN